MTFPLETIPPGNPIVGVVYLWIILYPEEASRIISRFWLYIIKLHSGLGRDEHHCVTFPRAVHKPAHDNKCDPLP